MRERSLFRDKAADFHIGIESFGDPAVDFQYQPVAIDDRRVALFALEQGRLQRSVRTAAQFAKHLGLLRVQFGTIAFEPPPARNGIQKQLGESPIVEGIVENAFRFLIRFFDLE